MGKPLNWDAMPREERRDLATTLINSARGKYILSQALYYGIKALRTVPEEQRETSNMEDMEMIQEEIFPGYAAVIGLEDRLRQKAKARPIKA